MLKYNSGAIIFILYKCLLMFKRQQTSQSTYNSYNVHTETDNKRKCDCVKILTQKHSFHFTVKIHEVD